MEWTLVMVFTIPQEAYIVRSLLEAEGVQTFLEDEDTASVHNFYSNAIGGVKLQVPAAQAGRAVEILTDAGYFKVLEQAPAMEFFQKS